jgi:quercetin dioxygenase-like cupin family protein
MDLDARSSPREFIQRQRDPRGLCLIASGWCWQKFVICIVTIWPAHSSHGRSGAETIGGNSKGTKTRARMRIHRLAGRLRSKDGHLMRAKTSLVPANPKTLIAESEEASSNPEEFTRLLRPPYPEATSVILSLPPGGEAKWLLHPASGHVFVLRGALTVVQEDGSRTKFKSGESFYQPRMVWHRCVNEGKRPMRCLLALPRAKAPASPQRVN